MVASAAAPNDVAAAGFRAHPIPWLRSVGTRLIESRSFGLAAEMAFWLFLSLLPLAAVAGLVTAKLTHGGEGATIAPLLDSLPAPTRDLLTTELGKVAAWNGGKVGASAALMFVWLASSGVHSILDGIEIESDATARPWWKKRLIGLAACVGLSVGLGALAVLGAGLGSLAHLVGSSLPPGARELESGMVGHVFRLVIGALLSFALIYSLYRVAVPPDGRNRTTPFAPGALVAVMLQAVVGAGYGFYIQRVGDGGAYQAGLASIGVTMTALYLLFLVLLVGSKVNEVVGEQRAATDQRRSHG
jgi:membrane protein